MELNALTNLDELQRPVAEVLAEGTYKDCKIIGAKYAEKKSNYTEDGKRVVLDYTVEVDYNGKLVYLDYVVTYNWSMKSNMVKFLIKMGCLPEPGENLSLEKLVGIPVEVTVENVTKNGVTYSNITGIKRHDEVDTPKQPSLKPIHKPLRKPEAEMITSEVEAKDDHDDDDIELDE